MDESLNKRKVPVFWIIYAVLMVISLIAVGLLLRKLYYFLDAYEATRPVHQAEKVVESSFTEKNRQTLKKLITNKIEQDTESVDDLLDDFFKSTENKKMTYGRYYGQYTDSKPQYILSVGEEQLASFALKETVKYDADFDFKLWDLESVTFFIQPKYSYAVTIPETMTLYVNGKEVPKTEAKGRKDSDCRVGYLEYSDTKFYFEPEIKVKDRAGHDVHLLTDQASGGYYYLLHYAYAPADMVVCFNGVDLTADEVMEKDIDCGVDYFMLNEVIRKYPEYKSLQDNIYYPTFTKYYVDLDVKEEDTTWKNRLNTDSIAVYDAETKTFSAGLTSDDSEMDELIVYATEFLKTYALFCSKDVQITEIQGYFPANSKYYTAISKMNNYWFNAHTDVSFQNYETKEFFSYGDNYAFVHVTFEQKMKHRASGVWKIYPIDLPVWLVKIDGEWYVGGMDFATYIAGFSDDTTQK